MLKISPSLSELQCYEINGFMANLSHSENVSSIVMIYNQKKFDSKCIQKFFADVMRPIIIINENYQEELSIKIPTPIMLLIFVENLSQYQLQPAVRITQNHRKSLNVFISKNFKHMDLYDFFSYLWMKRFRNPLLITKGPQFYGLHSFPYIKVLNLTGNPKITPSYKAPMQFNTIKLRVPVQTDVPAVFWYRNPKTGIEELDGIGGRFFKECMKYLNVSLETYKLYENGKDFFNIETINAMIFNGSLEISPNLNGLPFNEMNLSAYKEEYIIGNTYPAMYTRRCFLVPYNEQKVIEFYFLIPFQNEVWFALLFFMLLLELMSYILIRLYRINNCEHSHFEPGAGLLLAISIMLSMPMTFQTKLKVPTHNFISYFRGYVFYISALLMGSALNISYSTQLTSMLSVSLNKAPTTEKIREIISEVPILTSKTLYPQLQLEQPINTKFIQFNDSEFYELRDKFESKYVHSISELRWKFMSPQQIKLKMRNFWFTDICTPSYPLQFPIANNSVFYEPMHKFHLLVMQSGLGIQWNSDMYSKAVRMGLVETNRNPLIKSNGIENPYDSFKIISTLLYIYCAGILGSLVAFLGELLIHKICNCKAIVFYVI